MTHFAKKIARFGLLRYAALVAVVIPAALLAGCAQPAPAPPPPAQTYVAPAPPPPAPAVPVVRG